jgi:hypothetical protein
MPQSKTCHGWSIAFQWVGGNQRRHKLEEVLVVLSGWFGLLGSAVARGPFWWLWMIRWGVRPRIVTSSELCARAWRNVGFGGEHYAWWIKRAWSAAMEVAATLTAMAVWGTAVAGVVVGGMLGTRGIIHNPVRMHLLPQRIVRP